MNPGLLKFKIHLLESCFCQENQDYVNLLYLIPQTPHHEAQLPHSTQVRKEVHDLLRQRHREAENPFLKLYHRDTTQT